MAPRSLSTRLVAVVLLLLALAATIIAVVTTLILGHILNLRLEDDVRAASRIVVRMTSPPPTTAPPVPRYPDPDTLSVSIVDGNVVSAWVFPRDAAQVAVPSTAYPALLAVRTGPQSSTVDLGALGKYRVIAGPGPSGSTVLIGLPQSRVDDTVTQLVTVEVIVTLIALVTAGGVGLILIRRELRPLERVAATAARVSALPLDRGEVSLAERVPDVDARTEVGQVGAALNRMLDHVGAALEARQDSETQLRQFIADASHELRTPLAAIRGYAELTKRAQLTPEAAYSLTRISSQTERMTALVEDLLLLARLDAGRPLDRAPVDLTRLVLDTVNDAHVAGPDHRWKLDLPAEPVFVTGDVLRLTQVLTNLLANARTHTPPGTAVTVALDTGVHGGRRDVRISVVDEGPGITPDLLPHVFERFARGSSSRSRAHGSTGLGLAIVHAVVVAHSGRVHVTSRPGRTEFQVVLPAAAQPALRQAEPAKR